MKRDYTALDLAMARYEVLLAKRKLEQKRKEQDAAFVAQIPNHPW